jgi:tetratricopeptide (TPR) repeat protein
MEKWGKIIDSTTLNLLQTVPGVGIVMDMIGIDIQSMPRQKQITNPVELYQAVCRMFYSISHGRSLTVIFIDDAQWMDRSSMEMIEYLLKDIHIKEEVDGRDDSKKKSRKSKGNNIAIMMTIDSSEESGKELIKRYSRLQAKKFAIDDPSIDFVTRLLNESLNIRQATSEKLVSYLKNLELHHNLFWVLESIRLLDDQKAFIQINRRHFELEKEFQNVDNLPLPSGIRKNFNLVIENLGEKERSLLECASLIGTKFSLKILSDILDVSRMDLLQMLQRIEMETNLVRDVMEEEDVFEFTQPSVAKIFIDNLYRKDEVGGITHYIPPIAREYHYRIALSLEKLLGDNPNLLAETANHAYLGGRRLGNKALDYCRRAAEQAFSGGMYYEVGSLAEMSLSLLGRGFLPAGEDRLDLKVRLITLGVEALRICGEKGNVERRIELIEAGLADIDSVSGPGALRARLLCHLSLAYYDDRQWEKQCETAREVIDMDGAPPVERAQAFHNLALGLSRIGKTPDEQDHALEIARKGLAIAGKIRKGSKDFHEAVKIQSQITNSMGDLLLYHPDASKRDGARQKYESSLKLKVKINDLFGQAISLGGLGRYYLYKAEAEREKGNFDRAEEFYLESMKFLYRDLEISKDIGDIKGQTIILSQIGSSKKNIGDYGGALEDFAQSLELAEIRSEPVDQIYALAGLIDTCAAKKSWDRLNEYGRRVVAVLDSMDNKNKDEVLGVVEKLKESLSKHKTMIDNWIDEF